MLEHDRKLIHSSTECNWRTPPELFEALDRAFHFYWDAAADKTSRLVRLNEFHEHYFGPDAENPDHRDALTYAWAYSVFRGPIFLNPPYSRTQKKPIDPWAQKCWVEAAQGCTIVALLPFAPQPSWYRAYVYGHGLQGTWRGFAAMEEWRIPHRVSFLRPDGSPASNAGVNSVVIVWRPNPGFVGPWQPAVRYWSYR
jgi:DNA (cytosine-5)-methyltransferase 1